MGNFRPLTAEIGSGVWGTHANFNGFLVLAALLHGTVVMGVSQTLRHRTEGATYIRQGGHHVGHWSTFLVSVFLSGSNFSDFHQLTFSKLYCTVRAIGTLCMALSRKEVLIAMSISLKRHQNK